MPIVQRKRVPALKEAGGVLRRFLATAELGTASLTVVEVVLPLGGRLPLHVHPGHEECVVVLGGPIEATLGEETATVGRGAAVIVPPGVPHALRNVASRPARVLGIFPTTQVQRQLLE
ncbi:MAG: cupin domain-containing protein [Chloroflexi bacterium]|nr:cupin domain-containing protein [Chloroflexota bacterium]